MPQVKFDLTKIEEHDVIPYSQIYGCHPSRFVFQKNGSLLKLLKSDDSSCGVPKSVIKARRSTIKCDASARSHILHEVLVNGPSWEISTTELILKISKKTFKARRVGGS